MISPLKASDFPEYDALTITFDGGEKKQTYDFLLSKDKKTLIRMTKLDLTKDPYAEVMKKIDIKGRPTRGNKDAKVIVVSFDDLECPFCSRMHETLFPALLKEYGDRVLFVYKDFPLSEIHPWAMHAAVDADCLASQDNGAYWDFADYIHANQREVNSETTRNNQFAALDQIALKGAPKYKLDAAKLQACIKAQNDDVVKASVKEGESLGMTATPTLFVNGQEVDGALSAAALRKIFDEALEQAGVPPPKNAQAAASAPTGNAAR
ncbi:MAG: DsbA family protein [Terriglobales bacterium]|nr:thioredoxin domain-containing protein [Terriglobales bacterium]